MSPPGRPKGEYRSAQHEGTPVRRGAGLYCGLGLSICLLAACQTPPPPPPTHGQIVRDQLTQILATQHPACGAVRLYSRRDRLDYRVECTSGQAYRLRVSGDGRVLLKPYDDH
jgi:hypothetical protein